ncbi:MAG: hypothetical protein RBG13Loki_3712 [Promethearchaeota archaeon CR_4]|nr:MAG: hypothetical protein RBG13Loki_3712 [Candidatus Lokiarchaeota archaeon CR_4]
MEYTEYTVKIPTKLDKYFRILSDLFQWEFKTPSALYTHFVLDALGAELELLKDVMNPKQHDEFLNIIEDAKYECSPPTEKESEDE